MLREISLKRALDLMENGQEVRCLIPGADLNDWSSYTPVSLKDFLTGVVCLEAADDTTAAVEETPPPRIRPKR